MDFRLDRFASALGEILLVFDGSGRLRALDFADCQQRMERLLRLHYGTSAWRPAPAPAGILDPLRAYFAGDHAAVGAIAVETGGTLFQRAVWNALRSIPPGQTSTYGVVAQRVGRPAASRAVGLANGANPIAIAIPCHRVIGAGGALTGFGGGLHRKAWLLAHEQACHHSST